MRGSGTYCSTSRESGDSLSAERKLSSCPKIPWSKLKIKTMVHIVTTFHQKFTNSVKSVSQMSDNCEYSVKPGSLLQGRQDKHLLGLHREVIESSSEFSVCGSTAQVDGWRGLNGVVGVEHYRTRSSLRLYEEARILQSCFKNHCKSTFKNLHYEVEIHQLKHIDF